MKRIDGNVCVFAERLDIPVLALHDIFPHIQRILRAGPAEIIVTHKPADEADIIGAEKLAAGGRDALLDADINSPDTQGREMADQNGIKGVDSFHDRHFIFMKHNLPAVGIRHMLLKIENRHFAAVVFHKPGKALLNFFHIQRLETFVVPAAVGTQGGAVLSQIKIVQRNTDAPDTDLFQRADQPVGGRCFSAAGRPRQHNQPAHRLLPSDLLRDLSDILPVRRFRAGNERRGIFFGDPVNFIQAVPVRYIFCP